MIANKNSSEMYQGYEIVGFDDGTYDIFLDGQIYEFIEFESVEDCKACINGYGRAYG